MGINLRPTKTMNINLKPNKILAEEIRTNDGRHWNLYRIIQVSDYIANIKPGSVVVANECNTLDFAADGKDYSIINPEDIVATIDNYVE